MDLRQLAYFVRVAELGSFTRASIALDVAQPALSRHVRMLEVELRQNLLIRNGRGVSLTEAGRVLTERARGILHQVEIARQEVENSRVGFTGRVALGLPPSQSRVLTVPITRSFRERAPAATISVREGLSAALQEALVAGQLDIALLYNAVPSPEIDIDPLLEEDLFFIERRSAKSRSARTVPLSELSNTRLIIPSRPNAIRMLVELELAQIGLHPQIELEIDSIAAILDLVADGAGCAVLSKAAITATGNTSTYEVRPIVKPRLRTRLFLATSARRAPTAAQRLLVEIIGKAIKRPRC
jgi:LysR family nitrogen assimilation transcriptional regulator